MNIRKEVEKRLKDVPLYSQEDLAGCKAQRKSFTSKLLAFGLRLR